MLHCAKLKQRLRDWFDGLDQTRSLSDAYYGSGALTLLGAEGDIKAEAVCPLAHTELGKASLDLESAYFASHVLKRAR